MSDDIFVWEIDYLLLVDYGSDIRQKFHVLKTVLGKDSTEAVKGLELSNGESIIEINSIKTVARLGNNVMERIK